MNTTFDKNINFDSKSRIFETCFEEAKKLAKQIFRGVDSFLCIIIALLNALTSAKTVAIFKLLGVAGALIGFVGIIGAVEQGTLTLGTAFLIGAILIGIEYLCLRPRRA